MKRVNLSADIRQDAGNRESKRLRKHEMIPGVLYERAASNTLLKVNEGELHQLLAKHGENVVVQLNLNGRDVPAIIKEVQRHPVDKRIIHVDFQPVSLHEVIHAEVPIVIINGERVEKGGLVLNRQMNNIEVEGAVENIPESLHLDASKLKLGDVLKVGDIEFSEEISIISNLNEVILSVRASREDPIDLVFDRTEPELVEGKE